MARCFVVNRGLLGRVRGNSGVTIVGGGVVARCVCGKDSAVASLTERVSLDIPAIAGFVSRVYRRNCVGSCKGLRADKKERPDLCNLGTSSKCFMNIRIHRFSVGLKLVGFGKSMIRLGVGIPFGTGGAPRDLSRLYGLVGRFLRGIDIRGSGVLGVGMGLSKHIGPSLKCDCDVFGFSRHPLASIVSRGINNCHISVSGSAHTVVCNRCVRNIIGNRGGVVFVGID